MPKKPFHRPEKRSVAPAYYQQLEVGKVSNFKRWLTACGAEVLRPTNSWEVVRFSATEGVSVIYRNKRGDLTWTGESRLTWESWVNAESWRGGDSTKRGKVTPIMASILERDGADCFYCGKPMDKPTVEHLCAATHGGPNHLANFAAVHAECGRKAGHLSVVEKVRFREGMRTNANEATRRTEVEASAVLQPGAQPAGHDGLQARDL